MKTFIMFLLLFAIASNSYSQTETKRKKIFNLEKGVALNGYDPLSYFSGKPQPGNQKLSYTYNGVTYHFLSTDNREKFISSPDQFEPQYGGWCAYAIGSTGKKVKIDPTTYQIKDGKLYLFYNFNSYNTFDLWIENESELKPAADKNWNLLYLSKK